MMFTTESFTEARRLLATGFKTEAERVSAKQWQGVDVSTKPEMVTNELRHVMFKVPLFPHGENRRHWQDDVKPNLPWADHHFEERVCGAPINPGVEWENWPYNKSAEGFLEEGIFNHNYMERFWPRFAAMVKYPIRTASEWFEHFTAMSKVEKIKPRFGIREEYGDLIDLVNLIAADPLTRQAYFPLYHPEDVRVRGRKPCTLGYQFILRENRMDIVYHMRSVDFVRHFNDDIYLAIRLLLWVLNELRCIDRRWRLVQPGWYVMTCTSLHTFQNDQPYIDGILKGKNSGTN